MDPGGIRGQRRGALGPADVFITVISSGQWAALKTARQFWKREETLGENSVRCSGQRKGAVRMGRRLGPIGARVWRWVSRRTAQTRGREPGSTPPTGAANIATPPSPERDPAPAPPPCPAIPPAHRNRGALGSDCLSPQALQCARRQGGRSRWHQGRPHFSKGAVREAEVLPTLGRSQGGGRRAGWEPGVQELGGHKGPGGQPGGLWESRALTSWRCLLPRLICNPSSWASKQRQVTSGALSRAC